jgi:hypothetical protein
LTNQTTNKLKKQRFFRGLESYIPIDKGSGKTLPVAIKNRILSNTKDNFRLISLVPHDSAPKLPLSKGLQLLTTVLRLVKQKEQEISLPKPVSTIEETIATENNRISELEIENDLPISENNKEEITSNLQTDSRLSAIKQYENEMADKKTITLSQLNQQKNSTEKRESDSTLQPYLAMPYFYIPHTRFNARRIHNYDYLLEWAKQELNSKFHIFVGFPLPNGKLVDLLILSNDGAWLFSEEHVNFTEIYVDKPWKYALDDRIVEYADPITTKGKNPYQETIKLADELRDFITKNRIGKSNPHKKRAVFPCIVYPNNEKTNLIKKEMHAWCYLSKGVTKVLENLEKRKWDDSELIDEQDIKNLAECLRLKRILYTDLMTLESELEIENDISNTQIGKKQEYKDKNVNESICPQEQEDHDKKLPSEEIITQINLEKIDNKNIEKKQPFVPDLENLAKKFLQQQANTIKSSSTTGKENDSDSKVLGNSIVRNNRQNLVEQKPIVNKFKLKERTATNQQISEGKPINHSTTSVITSNNSTKTQIASKCSKSPRNGQCQQVCPLFGSETNATFTQTHCDTRLLKAFRLYNNEEQMKTLKEAKLDGLETFSKQLLSLFDDYPYESAVCALIFIDTYSKDLCFTENELNVILSLLNQYQTDFTFNAPTNQTIVSEKGNFS